LIGVWKKQGGQSARTPFTKEKKQAHPRNKISEQKGETCTMGGNAPETIKEINTTYSGNQDQRRKGEEQNMGVLFKPHNRPG